MILDIDEERRRISLGMKQCHSNPWEDFAGTHSKGDRMSGVIKSITDFGIFVGLPGGIDGLLHLSDLSWTEEGEEAVHKYKKGDEIDTVILGIDPERERISLGIKQIDRDPFDGFLAAHPKGSIVTGTVATVDAKGATVTLEDDVEGTLKAADISRERVEDVRSVLSEGDSVEARIVGVDRKNHTVTLSIKAKDHYEEQQAVKDYSKSTADANAATTLGDLLKEQMDNN
jgi:small subunit ribosomal protein S1